MSYWEKRAKFDRKYREAFDYIKLGMKKEFDEMLEQGFDINTENWVNQNLLTQMFYVPLRSREESMMHLILRGIDVNYVDGENETALYKAVRGNLLQITKVLIEKGADLQKGKDFSTSCSDKKYNKIRHFLLSLDGLTEEQRNNLQKI